MMTVYKILTAALLFCVTGCYPMISGRVVDAETGKPLEGAVARAEWHDEKGVPGLSYTELGKAAEAVTDSKGRFRMAGDFPFFAPSVLAVYKKGYIAWREYAVFPGYEKRKDCCRNGLPNVFRLERFVEGVHSHNYHIDYIESGLMDINSSSKLVQAYDREYSLGIEEYELYKKKKDSLNKSGKNQKELWKEVLEELKKGK